MPENMKLEPFEMFKVLAMETRVKIIELLKSKGPLGANSIAKQLGITPSAVSQQLRLLRQAGLVRSERKGYWIPYSIDPEALENCRCLLNEVCTCGCGKEGPFKEKEMSCSSLESLKKYEKELRSELIVVRAKIKEIEKKAQ